MNKDHHSILSLKFWPNYFVHMRPYLLFISGIAGLSGMALGLENAPIGIEFILAFVAFFLSYGFGQALTDCFQVDTDTLSASYRPLSKGILSIKHVKIVSIAGLILCVIFLLIPNYRNILLGVLSIIGLSTYTTVKKKYWAGGPFYNAWIVALLPIMGYLVTTGANFSTLLNDSLFLVVLLNLFAYSNFVLIGYLKDISADKATGYRTFPVVWGWDKTVIVGFIISVISIILCALFINWSIISTSIFIIAGVLSLTGNVMALLSKSKTEEDATIPILMTVRSFILWNLAIITSIFPDWLIPGVIYFLLFELVLKFRPEKGQI